jgi:type II restriction enzyme
MKFIKKFWDRFGVTNEEQAKDYFKKRVMRTIKVKGFLNKWSSYKERLSKMDQKVITMIQESVSNLTLKKIDIDEFKSEIFGIITSNFRSSIDIIRAMMVYPKDEKDIIVLKENEGNDNEEEIYFDLSNKNPTEDQLKTLFFIMEHQSFFEPFELGLVSSVESFIFSLMAGLDSNGRKNRSGKEYEKKIAKWINALVETKGVKSVVLQANKDKVIAEFGEEGYAEIKASGKDIPDAIFKTNKYYYLVEMNYSDGGSKLSETIRGYEALQRKINESGKKLKFIYITDGRQWEENEKKEKTEDTSSEKKPNKKKNKVNKKKDGENKDASNLETGWKNIDYIVNYNMVKNLILEHIIDEEEK